MSKGLLLGMLVVCAALAGCGDDSDGEDAGSGGSAGTAGSGGTGGTGATGGSGGTGGSTSDAGDDAAVTITCDDTMLAEPTCGGVTCPELDTQALDQCQITCCTDDDECGTKNTSAQAIAIGLGACSVPAVEDPDCPGVSFGGQSGFGCCLESGFCGVAGANTPCIDISGFGGGTPTPCGEGADAGTL